jgi:hypothetical protein
VRGRGGYGGSALLVGEGVAAFCSSVSSSTALTQLSLLSVQLFDSLPDAQSLLAACGRCASLRRLGLSHNIAATSAAEAAVGEALAPLTETRLTHLEVSHCGFGDAAFAPLLRGVAQSGSMVSLDVSFNDYTEPLAVAVLDAVTRCATISSCEVGLSVQPALIAARALAQTRARQQAKHAAA